MLAWNWWYIKTVRSIDETKGYAKVFDSIHDSFVLFNGAAVFCRLSVSVHCPTRNSTPHQYGLLNTLLHNDPNNKRYRKTI